MKRLKDTAYLSVSTQIRSMENTLLTRDRLEQALEARSVEEALKVVQECGYSGLHSAESSTIDEAILAARESLERELRDSLPDRRILDLLKLKHDYHNLKTLLKARLARIEVRHILVDLGRVSPEALRRALEEEDYSLLPHTLAAAAVEAREILDTTRDGQLMDVFLDRCYYREMVDLAREMGSPFLEGYVRRQIESANLRSLVRTLRMGKGPEFLMAVLVEGGEIPEEELLRVSREGGNGLSELYAPTAFAAAAEAAALSGGPLTEFERLCDDAVSEYLSMARFVPFGEEVVIAYLAARETEFTNLRILLLGRSMDLPAEVIRARLRN